LSPKGQLAIFRSGNLFGNPIILVDGSFSMGHLFGEWGFSKGAIF
jgi:hypothetical protein